MALLQSELSGGAAFFGSFMILIVVGGSLLFASRVSNGEREGG